MPNQLPHSNSNSFVHLRVHSEFSLIDGIVKVRPSVERAAEQGMLALGISDQCNFFGLIKFYKACLSQGIKPIVGADFLMDAPNNDDSANVVTLIAMSNKGYERITELISMAFQKGQRQGIPYIQRQWLSHLNEGIIVLSGGRLGDIGSALLTGKEALASELLKQWQTDFPGRFYLELQRTGRENEEEYIYQVMNLAESQQCPVVATNDVRFLNPNDFEAHEARVCIGEGRTLDDPRRERRYSDQQYFKSAEEMQEIFSDIPEAIENTWQIARRCSVVLRLGEYFLPEYPIPEDFSEDRFFQTHPWAELEQRAISAMEEKWQGKELLPEYKNMLTTNIFFQKVSIEGLEDRLPSLITPSQPNNSAKIETYFSRLYEELIIIMQMGFPGYFLIVMDFIQWAKDNQIPVGPGRGSGAGSIVAYSLKITDLDPIEYDLLFERFLNPERVSMPDFDIDFCMDKRDQVIAYVAKKYGRDAVSQIITFGTMAAKAVVRDVGRVQGKSYGLADKLSKMIPPDVGMTLKKALEQEEILQDFLKHDDEGQEIWDMAVLLEGITRNVGKHAGGVVIAPTKLTDFSPLYCDETGNGVVTQFDKNDVEEAGLVKFDFLGLRTLTIIDWAINMVNLRRQNQGESALDIAQLPLDDEKTFTMLKRADTTAVFQLESRGMKDLIKRMKPDCLEDLIALVALFRPGPLQSGMVDDFINRKHGRESVSYPHPQYQHQSLKPILEPTYGVIVYQEQVMQIAQTLAGYTLGGADLLRRAMGKKKPEEMAKQREIFESGAAKQGVDPNLAMKIFDLVEKFAGYGFNKSHSAAYAYISYQTAWLKAHYPSQFMAATMSSDMDKTDKVVTFIEDCRQMGLNLLPPDVNAGEYMFTVDEEDNIVYGLGAIKGLGEGPIESIIEARNSGGEFTSVFDFCARTDARKVNKRALEALVFSGAFDRIGPESSDLGHRRSVLSASLNEAVKAAEQANKNAQVGMVDLFGDLVPSSSEETNVYGDFLHTRSWSVKDRLEREKDTLGLYLTGHPIDQYNLELRQLVPKKVADLTPERRQMQHVAGLVVNFRVMKNKKGDKMAFLTLDDRSGRIEVALFADVYNDYRELIAKDAILVVEGEVSIDDYSGGMKMRALTVKTLEQTRSAKVNHLTIHLDNASCSGNTANRLSSALRPHVGGSCKVSLIYLRPEAKVHIKLGKEWLVSPSDQLLQELRAEYGQDSIKLNYQ